MARQWVPAGYETLTIAASALTLASVPSTLAKSFIGTLETGQVRYRGDGSAPTASEGQLLEVGDSIVMSESEFASMQFIRTGSTSGVLKGHYYTVEPDIFGR
jgi:hypothetical protein